MDRSAIQFFAYKRVYLYPQLLAVEPLVHLSLCIPTYYTSLAGEPLEGKQAGYMRGIVKAPIKIIFNTLF
jgi:hypothetical protein